MRVTLSIGTIREAGTVDIDATVLAKAEVETRWQLGVAILNGLSRAVERKLQLGEWVYRFQGHLLDPKSVEAYLPNEWIDWRDN
jgi:hypothetical protein